MHWRSQSDLSTLAVAKHPEPAQPVDADALARLIPILTEAAQTLHTLGVRTAAVASAPDKFNDAGWGKWLLVRVDDEVVEYDSYHSSRNEYEAAVTTGSIRLKTAAATLSRLEEADWRGLWTRAYGLPFHEEFLALMVEYGVPWLLYATSNQGGRDHVFKLSGDAPEYFCECVDRMDDHLSGLEGEGPDILKFLLEEQ